MALGLVSAGLGVLGNIFGNKSQTVTTTNQNQFNNQNTYGTTNVGATNAVLNPTAASLLKEITDKYTGMISQDPDLTGYQASQAAGIAHNTDLQRQQAVENEAARGVTGGPAAAAAVNNVNAQGFQQQNQLNQSIPLLKQQLIQQQLQLGQGIFSSIPTSQETESYGSGQQNQSGTSSGTSTTKGPSNVLAGGFGAAGSALAGLYGQKSAANSNPNSGNGGFVGQDLFG